MANEPEWKSNLEACRLMLQSMLDQQYAYREALLESTQRHGISVKDFLSYTKSRKIRYTPSKKVIFQSDYDLINQIESEKEEEEQNLIYY